MQQEIDITQSNNTKAIEDIEEIYLLLNSGFVRCQKDNRKAKGFDTTKFRERKFI